MQAYQQVLVLCLIIFGVHISAQQALADMKAHADKMRIVIIEQQEQVDPLRMSSRCVTSLFEQIENLNKSLNGNKSHFAKFVELKEQNVALSVSD
jgi:hypothetical protein